MPNIQPEAAGSYSVIVSNFAGSIVHERAQVFVDVPLHITRWILEARQPARFWVAGNSGQQFVLEASADLSGWRPLFTNRIIGPPLHLEDPESYNGRNKFYRARPWP
jgi:hypothetical protein